MAGGMIVSAPYWVLSDNLIAGRFGTFITPGEGGSLGSPLRFAGMSWDWPVFVFSRNPIFS